MDLRPYQREAVDATIATLRKHGSALIVHPTGTGKTIIAAELARRCSGRVLMLAHREELVRQAADKFTGAAGVTCTIEMADEHANAEARVVVASIQTMQGRRLEAFAPDAFRLVIADEAHHATSVSWRRTLGRFRDHAAVVGMTATPDRLDKQGLIGPGRPFAEVADVYEVRDAIRDGWLCSIRQQRIIVDDLDFSGVRTRLGDFVAEDLEKLLVAESVLHEIAAPIVDLAGDRRTIVFCLSVVHAAAMAAMINRYKEQSAIALSGTAGRVERHDGVAAFQAGKAQFLCNCALFLEGFDAPETSCIAMARPTQSRALYAQAVGRGTRIAPGKADLLIIDFTDNSETHSLITAADVIDGGLADDVRAAATRIATRKQVDIVEAIAEAEQEIAEERRAGLLAKARHRSVVIDPFTLMGVERPGRRSSRAATDRQIAAIGSWVLGRERRDEADDFRAELARLGICVAEMDVREASKFIETLVRRKDAGLCSFKMARVLARAGLSPDVSFEVARGLMDVLSRNGWRATDAMRAEHGVRSPT